MPTTPPQTLDDAIARIEALRAEHRPILAQILADPGIATSTRKTLVDHLIEEEDERFDELAAGARRGRGAPNKPTTTTTDAPSTHAGDDMPSSTPLNDTQWQFLKQEIVREARRTLVARRFLGVYGPLGAGMETVAVEAYGPDRDAEIELVGKHDADPIVAERLSFLRVPILYKDFVQHWRDVERSSKLGAPLDASRAIRAAHFVADREDQLIFNGEPRFQLEGLLNATGRNHIERSDWSQYGNAYRDVVRATEVLLSHNHHRPFALAVSAKEYARLVQQKEGQFAPEIDAIIRLCDDGVFTSPAIPDGKAVLLSTGDQNVDLAITEDLTIAYLGERDQDFPFRVYECLVLRIKRPKAICTIG